MPVGSALQMVTASGITIGVGDPAYKDMLGLRPITMIFALPPPSATNDVTPQHNQRSRVTTITAATDPPPPRTIIHQGWLEKKGGEVSIDADVK